MNAEGHRRYVAGFLIQQRPGSTRVLLVRKTHPKWQENMMNAIGGEIEEGETTLAAMIREFTEEAQFCTPDWTLFCIEYGPGYEVHFFRAFLHRDAVYKPPKVNDSGEELEWRDIDNPKYPVIGNLNWLLPLAQDPRQFDCVVRTTSDIRKIVTW